MQLYQPVGATAVAFGETLSDTINPGVELDTYTFAGTAGDQPVITLTRTSGTMDPQVRTFRPDGTSIGGCSGATVAPQLQVTCTLDATGTHIILVSDNGGDETGNYDLTLSGP